MPSHRRPAPRRLKIAALVVLGLVGAAGGAYAAARAGDPEAFTSTLVALHSEQCLAPARSGPALQQAACTASGTQFTFTRASDGSYEVRGSDGLCVDVRGGARTNGAPVIRYRCSGTANQRFTLRATATAAAFQVVARHSGKCLDVFAGRTTAGAPVDQWTCGDPASAGNQVWRISAAPVPGTPSATGSSSPTSGAPDPTTVPAGGTTSAPAPSTPFSPAPSPTSPTSATTTSATGPQPGPVEANPAWGKSGPPADAVLSTQYVAATGAGYHPSGTECSAEVHGRYWTYGPDGKVYPTWHPAKDPSGCSFGHEHGDDPRTSVLFASTGWPPFGYANEQRALSDPDKGRLEDPVGHKIAVGNAVAVHQGSDGENAAADAPVTMTCDTLMMFHQGTASNDATHNNLHELQYNARCTYADDGSVIQTRFKALLPLGNAGGFTATQCGHGSETVQHTGVAPAVPADSPNGFGGRFIPDADCAAAVLGGSKTIFDTNEFWFTGIFARSGKLASLQLFPSFFVANPSRYFDATDAGLIKRQIDLCYAGATGFSCDQVRRLTAANGGVKLAFNDPRSPFNGAQRVFSPGLFVVQNTGPTTLYTDSAASRWSTTPFPGSIEQFVSGNHAGDRSQGSISGTFRNYAQNTSDGVHSPN